VLFWRAGFNPKLSLEHNACSARAPTLAPLAQNQNRRRPKQPTKRVATKPKQAIAEPTPSASATRYRTTRTTASGIAGSRSGCCTARIAQPEKSATMESREDRTKHIEPGLKRQARVSASRVPVRPRHWRGEHRCLSAATPAGISMARHANRTNGGKTWRIVFRRRSCATIRLIRRRAERLGRRRQRRSISFHRRRYRVAAGHRRTGDGTSDRHDHRIETATKTGSSSQRHRALGSRPTGGAHWRRE